MGILSSSFVEHLSNGDRIIPPNQSAAKHYPCFPSYKYAFLIDLDFNFINRSMQTLPKFRVSASVRK